MTDLLTRAFVGAQFECRRNDLLAEGWSIMFERYDQIGGFCKLRHRNGKIITLSCDYGTGTITQKTNGKVTHLQTVRKS